MLPPQPRLFKAVAILGMLLGSLGAVNGVGGILSLDRSEHTPAWFPGFEPGTEAEARVARRMQQGLDRVIERHRKVSAALHLANAALSLVLLVGSVSLASRRSWAHAIMLQALVASAIYELPAAVNQIRLVYETMLAQKRLVPDLLRAMNQPVGSGDLAVTSVTFLFIGVGLTIAATLLRLAYYGTGFWYLRRRDVRAWFDPARDT